MTIFAYIRVSTNEQTTDNQKKSIIDGGFAVDEWISEDGVSGMTSTASRPAFSRMMESAKEGDTVICTMIDRIGRSTVDVLTTVEMFQKRGIKLRIMQFGGIDLTSSMGKFTLTVMAACAEMERNILAERTKAGVARTKADGTHLGQPLKIIPSDLKKMCNAINNGISISELSKEYEFPRTTISRNIEKWKDNLDAYEEEYYDRMAQYEKAKSI